MSGRDWEFDWGKGSNQEVYYCKSSFCTPKRRARKTVSWSLRCVIAGKCSEHPVLNTANSNLETYVVCNNTHKS